MVDNVILKDLDYEIFSYIKKIKIGGMNFINNREYLNFYNYINKFSNKDLDLEDCVIFIINYLNIEKNKKDQFYSKYIFKNCLNEQ